MCSTLILLFLPIIFHGQITENYGQITGKIRVGKYGVKKAGKLRQNTGRLRANYG